MASQDGDILADLECGGTSTEEEGGRESISSSSSRKKTLSSSAGSVLTYNGSISSESDTDSSDSFSKPSSHVGGRVELLIEGSSGGEERNLVASLDKKKSNDQRKKSNMKKSSKPPRPPKGPSLNASDLKLVRELSELAARKRARIERMRAVRKMKEARHQSSSSSLFGLIITIFFFIIILFQGVLSQNNVHRVFQGSPAPAVATDGLIRIAIPNNAPANKPSEPHSLSLNSPQHIYTLKLGEVEGRDIR